MKNLLTLLTFLSLSYFSYSQCQMVMRPDSTSGQDAQVWSLPCNSSYAQQSGLCDTSIFSETGYLSAYAWTHLGTPTTARSFLQFDLDSLASIGCQVTSARLLLFAPQIGATQFHCGSTSTLHPCNSNQLDITRIVEPWQEDTLMWWNQPVTTNGVANSDITTMPDQDDPYLTYEIDLTNMVNYWLAEPDSNFGIRLALSDETYYTRTIFGSSNHPNPNKRPTLLLELNCPNTCTNLIEGYVYDDANGDCSQDVNEGGLEGWFVEIQPGPFYAITDSNGYYSAWVGTDNYMVTQLIPNSLLWNSICPSPYEYNVSSMSFGDTTSNIDFGVQANAYCPQLTLDIGTGFFRKGHISPLFVQYCNNGNITADSTYITMILDTALTALTSTLAWDAPQSGNVFTFQTGTLEPGECGYFTIDVQVGLGVFLDQTLCVEAEMFPGFNCSEPQDSTWDKSSVMVTGNCVDDSLACFTITNTGDVGDGDMQGTSEYRIYENNVLVYTGTFQITGQDDIVICWPGNGNTIRLEADQRPGHPGNSHPNDVVEACGTDSGGSFVTGYVLDMPLDNGDPTVAIECHPVIFSYDPNDKTAYPSGIDEEGYIMNHNELEYRIRFQNTGNDTAFNIVIRDTLSQYLDPTSVVSGVSSHSYDFNVYGHGVLEWRFNNILLPDSNVNESGSKGFVKFRVSQRPGNVPGNEITNNVGIYFDYNEPVITNTTLNTIWLGEQNASSISLNEGNVVSPVVVKPNPFDAKVEFVVQGAAGNEPLTLEIFDITGRKIESQNSTTGQFELEKGNIKSGIYLYSIRSSNKLIGQGKIISQ